MPTPADALARLESDPGSFLRQYPVSSLAMGKSQYVNYWFGHAAGPQNAAGVPDDVRTIKFTIKKNRFFDEHRVFGRKFFRFSPIKSEIQDPALHRLVWNVPTTSIDDASVIHSEIPGVAVSRNNGPGLMITPMISGCTFICTPMGHAVLMAHVKPKEGEGGRLHGLVQHGTINIRGGRGCGRHRLVRQRHRHAWPERIQHI